MCTLSIIITTSSHTNIANDNEKQNTNFQSLKFSSTLNTNTLAVSMYIDNYRKEK